MPQVRGNFLSLHGNAVGLAKGLITGSSTHLAGAQLAGLLETVSSGLTATAGGTQATSTPVSSTINQFTTVASANDGATLPVAVKGMKIWIINDAASNAMKVFGNPLTSDTIDGVATATGVVVTAAKRSCFIALNDALVAEGTQAAVVGLWVSLEGVKSV